VTYLAAILAMGCFGAALRVLGVVAVARRVVAINREAVGWIRNAEVDDIEKEKLIRRASGSLLRAFFSIAARGAAAFGVAALPVLAFAATGLAAASSVTQFLATFQGVLLAAVVMTAAYMLKTTR
jgi:hypothetical protein